MKMSLQEYAYSKCQELIQDGDLIPGKLYSEVALSKELEVSRTPLRSAVQRLEKEGIVTRLPQRGFYVNEFDQKDIEELFSIRKAIEGFAAEQLAKNKGKFDLTQYQKHLSDQKIVSSSDDYRLFLNVDRKFHEDMVKTLDNKRLMEIYADLRQSISLFAAKRFKVDQQRTQSLSEHKAIVQAIQSGDPNAARESVYNHLDSVLDLLNKQKI